VKEAGRRRRTLRIAAIQMIAAPGEPESRRARAETLVERAASEGAALVALREMFAPGYLASREVWDLAEPLDRGPTVAWLQRTARRFGIHVAGGLVETDGRDFFDTFVVCTPAGENRGSRVQGERGILCVPAWARRPHRGHRWVGSESRPPEGLTAGLPDRGIRGWLAAHARDELGLTEELAARPLQAALASAATFAVGAGVPIDGDVGFAT
jgi:hypothetical protein